MVLIVPTSGCINVDLKNIARQMINIEQNNKIFSDVVKPAKCDCINKELHPKHKIAMNSQNEDDSFSCIRGNVEPFNVYKVPNPLDPEHPIEIETLSNVGTIAIYLNSRIVGEPLKKVIAKHLEIECTRAIMRLFSQDEEVHTNGIICVYKEACSSSQYTLVSKPTDMYATREIYYCGLEKKKSYASSYDTFIWNVYVIYANAYSMHNMLKYVGNGYDDLATGSFDDMSIGSKRNALDYSKLICNNFKDTISDIRKKQIEELKYLENSLLDIPFVANDKLSEKLYAPNMILLDAAGLFNTQVMLKQLEYPTVEQYYIPRFINIIIPIKGGYGYDYVVAQEFIRDNNLVPLFHMSNISPSLVIQNEFRKHFANLISHTSWYCANQLEQATDNTWNVISKRDRKKLTEIRHVYFMQPNGIDSNLPKDSDITENIQINLQNLVLQYGAKTNDSPFLNMPSDRCYITGVPLWNYYFELQFMCPIKINTKLTHEVLICMRISKLGMVIISDAARNANQYLNYAKYGELNFSASNIIGFLKVLFETCKAKIIQHNFIVKSITRTRINVISQLQSPLVRKLLATVDRFGSVYTHKNLYAVNPETNELFIGIHNKDYTDSFLLHVKKNSDAYIFRIC